jgi:hypothetical protein
MMVLFSISSSQKTKGRETQGPTALKFTEKKNRGTFGGAHGLNIFYVIGDYLGGHTSGEKLCHHQLPEKFLRLLL